MPSPCRRARISICILFLWAGDDGQAAVRGAGTVAAFALRRGRRLAAALENARAMRLPR